jgi:hypothetical protein
MRPGPARPGPTRPEQKMLGLGLRNLGGARAAVAVMGRSAGLGRRLATTAPAPVPKGASPTTPDGLTAFFEPTVPVKKGESPTFVKTGAGEAGAAVAAAARELMGTVSRAGVARGRAADPPL